MKRVRLIAGVLASVLPAWCAASPVIRVLPTAEVGQGGIAKIQVSGSPPGGLYLRERRIALFPEPDGSYGGLIGIDLAETPGAAELELRLEGGRTERARIWVKEKKFPEQHLTVPPRFERLDEALQRRIAAERERLDRLWSAVTPERYWEGKFVAPVQGSVTAGFGLRRIVNGQPRQPHAGVDFKAGLGAPVSAANRGRVVLREEHFFGGKSLVLDHGGGLFTIYLHLHDFSVSEGDEVRKGEIIGRVGMTGRATGPHLHWGARLNGARVDPLSLLEVIP
jgi:murein DD-endopeptidase MepM/ murein hydrolase activator NlpD